MTINRIAITIINRIAINSNNSYSYVSTAGLENLDARVREERAAQGLV